MSRSLSATVQTAIQSVGTSPVHLVRLGFDAEVRAACWDTAITWNGEVWIASGIEVSNLTPTGAKLVFPNGVTDPWLALVLGDGTRGRSIDVYEHHTDTASSPQSDAEKLFSGIMDEVEISDANISVKVIAAAESKGFPVDSIDRPTFTHMLKSGEKVVWGVDTVTNETPPPIVSTGFFR